MNLGGPDTLAAAPYHWADRNRDHRIDDDEILAAYDEFGGIDGLDTGLDEVENLWMGSGYRWDAQGHRFQVVGDE